MWESEILDEQDLEYCPSCGKELDHGEDLSVRCPRHGDVHIDFWQEIRSESDAAAEQMTDEMLDELGGDIETMMEEIEVFDELDSEIESMMDGLEDMDPEEGSGTPSSDDNPGGFTSRVASRLNIRGE